MAAAASQPLHRAVVTSGKNIGLNLIKLNAIKLTASASVHDLASGGNFLNRFKIGYKEN